MGRVKSRWDWPSLKRKIREADAKKAAKTKVIRRQIKK